MIVIGPLFAPTVPTPQALSSDERFFLGCRQVSTSVPCQTLFVERLECGLSDQGSANGTLMDSWSDKRAEAVTTSMASALRLDRPLDFDQVAGDGVEDSHRRSLT